jgi:hypothetical protein
MSAKALTTAAALAARGELGHNDAENHRLKIATSRTVSG